MTREEVIKLIDTHKVCFYNKIDSPTLQALNLAIEALSADTVQRWIPVTERLPEAPSFCLVTTDGSLGDIIDIALHMSDGWHKASKVIAWMPLPKPYKAESEDKGCR